MSIILALATAASFGVGDFCGAIAAKRTTVLRVVGLAHVIGLIGVTATAVAFDNPFTTNDLVFGMVGGAFGGAALALLYRGLAKGPMSVVAPVTAVTAAVVPALWSLARGERPGLLVAAGLIIALAAIWLVSLSNEDGDADPGTDIGERSRLVAVVEALVAGVGFGLFYISLDQTDPASAPWPIVSARVLTASALVAALLIGPRVGFGGDLDDSVSGLLPTGPDRMSTLAWIVGAGLLDTLANVLFLVALDHGSLAVVSILSSLYPIATVMLARLVLAEVMNRRQLVGLVLAVGATALISAG